MKPILLNGIQKSDLTEHAVQLSSALSQAYNTLQSATICVFESKRSVEEAEKKLQASRDVMLLGFRDDPKGLGHNEATREAALRARTCAEIAEVELAEVRLSHMLQEQSCASVEVEALRAQLRCLEALIAVLNGGASHGTK